MHSTIVLLTDLSYELGLIGAAEYVERMKVAEWLSDLGGDTRDPRLGDGQEDSGNGPERPTESATGEDHATASPGDDADPSSPYVAFLAMGTWMFTIGDRDCYPSVPHGHFRRKTTKWPKLNPYVGRVFKGMHSEDVGARLTRDEMKALWSDSDFVEHCRRQVLWYGKFAPDYAFPLARRGRLVFPRWR